MGMTWRAFLSRSEYAYNHPKQLGIHGYRPLDVLSRPSRGIGDRGLAYDSDSNPHHRPARTRVDLTNDARSATPGQTQS